MVPEALVQDRAPAKSSSITTQANGLPEGVKILPITSPAEGLATTDVTPEATPSTPVRLPSIASLVQPRARLKSTVPETTTTSGKRRKPGRPKAGRLDTPTPAASPTMPAPPLPTAPKIMPINHGHTTPKRLNDLTPRHAIPTPKAHAQIPTSQKTTKKNKAKRPSAHKVGIPPLHYGHVTAFSFRARARPRLVILAAMGALSLGAASAYGAWLLFSRGISGLATGLMQAGPKLAIEAGLFGLIYYIGRSLGQAAISYGIAREIDHRSVSLSYQLGIATNTFARRLRLDLGFCVAELLLIAAAVALCLTGGQSWPMPESLQVGLIFTTYLVILYALSALALSRGLAGINLTLTNHLPRTAAKIGWQLFSHRIELIGPRFGALLLEALLALPLAAVGIAFIVVSPQNLHIPVILGVGILAWVAGSLLGVGTAAWWTMLYHQLVATDRPNATIALFSARQPEDARRGALAFIISAVTLIFTMALVLPWLNLGF